MIIVEGPDGAGKTTLCQKLHAATDLPVIHSGGPPGSAGEVQERIRELSLFPRAIRDRCVLISEPIYGGVLRGQSFLREDRAIRLLHSLPFSVVLYCRPPEAVLFDHLDENLNREKSHKPGDHADQVRFSFDQIVWAYDKFMHKIGQSGIDVIRYTWEC